MKTKKLDIVYIVRPSHSNEELRYSLRSLKNFHHRKVYIIGYKPDFVTNVINIPTTHTTNIFVNSLNNIFTACEQQDISSNFILMHDDFFCMEPVNELFLNHKGPYEVPERIKTPYHKMRITSIDYFDAIGIEAMDFELHMPFLINKNAFLNVKQVVSNDINVLSKYDKMSLYGNILAPKSHIGKEIADTKFRHKNDEIPNYTSYAPFVSSQDRQFIDSKVYNILVNYPKSEYEL